MPIHATQMHVRDSVKLIINYDQPLDKLLKKGHYCHVDETIGSIAFPQSEKGKRKVTLDLVQFNRAVISSEIIDEIKVTSRRAATIVELLSFGSTLSNQRCFPMISALGIREWFSGQSKTVALQTVSEGKVLQLLPWTKLWRIQWLFLTIRHIG